jgi:hypothetical protein
MKNHETKTSWKRSSEAPHHLVVRGPCWPCHPVVCPPRSLFLSRFPPVPLFRCLIFTYITPQIAQGLYIMFSLCFCFYLFLSGVVLSFRGIMSSASSDKEKTLSKDDRQDPRFKEGHTAVGSRAREPTFVGSINTCCTFSHNM